MEPITSTFESATGLGPIFAGAYPIDNPRGVVQICHGMFEHFGRYKAFARFLNQRGYAVAGFDLAGHGQSMPNYPRGLYGERNGYAHLLEDIRTLQKITAVQYKGVPYFLLGHSMGSFLARAFCARYGSVLCGAIFMGTTGMGGLMPTVGKCILFPFPKQRPLIFYRTMSFAGYNKTYAKPCDTFAWISRDKAAVAAYKADPLRINTFATRGSHDLMCLIGEITKPSWYASVPKDLPVLLISGEDDPVGQYGKGVRKVAERLQKASVLDVSVKLYPNARHEVLNELNKDEVMEDIAAWLDAHTAPQDKQE